MSPGLFLPLLEQESDPFAKLRGASPGPGNPSRNPAAFLAETPDPAERGRAPSTPTEASRRSQGFSAHGFSPSDKSKLFPRSKSESRFVLSGHHRLRDGERLPKTPWCRWDLGQRGLHAT